MPGKTTKKRLGRPTTKSPKRHVTFRIHPDLLADLDTLVSETYLDRTALVHIAVRALIKRGLPKTLEAAS